MFNLDPAHESMELFEQEITQDVWKEKYRYGDEKHPFDSFRRVISGVYADDPTSPPANAAYDAMCAGLLVPAGRIQAGAGTLKRVTQMNCSVMPAIPDSLDGIFNVLSQSALTLQQGGGIGMDFSTLRPKGTPLKRTGAGAVSSGPVSYMDVWDQMCNTIKSAGARRGAMMAVMRCDHPDIIDFIEAKREAGRLTNFNLSVLITKDFMEAVERDDNWDLVHNAPPFKKGPANESYLYETISARELWQKIISTTYEYSEPGVIFIDRINELNNLSYIESISATNPCGEQPLPPYGVCCLGAINLARMVRQPFTDETNFDYELLKTITSIGVQFLDRVLDVTNYPLPEQKDESMAKRRIGLGVTGLANALMELQLRYGSGEAITEINKIMTIVRDTAYEASIGLAKARGSFGAYDGKALAKSPYISRMSNSIRDRIRDDGLRNGVILTIAPTGTTSLYIGNVSSGIEPVFAFSHKRKVLQADGNRKEYEVQDYGYRLYRRINSNIGENLKGYMVKSSDLNVRQHLNVQAACQKLVDASISKTINCHESMPFDEFKEVYEEAYKLGCKGCTTYRPNEAVRGSVLTEVDIDLDEIDFEDTSSIFPEVITPRPGKLRGTTYKVKWPKVSQAFYITINDIGNPPRPFEVFISSKSAKYDDWTTALSLMISAIFRRGGDVSFVPEELKQVVSATEGDWVGGEYVFSMVAQVGKIIEQHLDSLKEETRQYVIEHLEDSDMSITNEDIKAALSDLTHTKSLGEQCPVCLVYSLVHEEGCTNCHSCGYSSC